MKSLLLVLTVLLTAAAGILWGEVPVEGASRLKSLAEPLQQVTKFTIQGDGAFAHFTNYDECGYSDVQVGTNDEASKAGSGKAEINSTVFLVLYLENYCAGQFITFGNNFIIPPEALIVGDKLESVTLNTVVEACCDNITGEPFPVTISLIWTGTGPITKAKSTYTSKSPGCKLSYTLQGNYRDAVVDGSITALDMDLAVQPQVFGGIQSVKNGEMTIGCD